MALFSKTFSYLQQQSKFFKELTIKQWWTRPRTKIFQYQSKIKTLATRRQRCNRNGLPTIWSKTTVCYFTNFSYYRCFTKFNVKAISYRRMTNLGSTLQQTHKPNRRHDVQCKRRFLHSIPFNNWSSEYQVQYIRISPVYILAMSQ